jgi:glycerol uptake facilitator protein
MELFIGELIGTMFMVFFGDSVVASCVLKKTKSNDAGWMVITTAWALAVAVAVFIFGPLTGAHFNPAVTLGLAVIGKFAWADVPMYIIAQLIGGILAGVLVYINFKNHFKVTDDPAGKLAIFCTGPAIRDYAVNFFNEFFATLTLVFSLLGVANTEMAPGIAAIVVFMIIWLIGLALGGLTGYALNPARDLGPRIAHAFLPIPGKGSSDWAYAWVPVAGPILGGICGALAFAAIF